MSISAREILDELISANGRFVSEESESQNELSSSRTRHKLSTEGQKPVAAIVACSDSRVAPEIIFGAGIGRLFVIRNAGNVVLGDDVMGSLEFAVHVLKVPLVIVLGHSKCGAVTAAVGSAKESAENAESTQSPLTRHVSVIADVIKGDIGSKEEVKDATLTNIKHGVKSLKSSSPIADAHSSEKVTIVGALYDIHTGEVFVVDE